MDTSVVTGSTGFLGGYVTAALAHSGRRVLALSRRPVRSRVDNIVPVHATLEQLDPLRRTIAKHGCDSVFHFAAAVSTASVTSGFEAASSTNVLGTARLLDLVTDSSVRLLVYASGINVYAPSSGVLREDSAVAPADPYAFSKYCGELACATFSSSTGVRSVSLRISSPYGPGMNERTVLPIFLHAALEGRIPRYHGTGSRRQNFVAAEDVAQACLLALEHGAGVYNIGGQSASMRELAGLALEAAGRDASEADASGQLDPQEGRAFELSSERARAELGYSPRETLQTRLRALYSHLKEQKPLQRWWQEV